MNHDQRVLGLVIELEKALDAINSTVINSPHQDDIEARIEAARLIFKEKFRKEAPTGFTVSEF